MFQMFLMKKHLEKHVLKCGIYLSAKNLKKDTPSKDTPLG
jgi:hypothetical protein